MMTWLYWSIGIMAVILTAKYVGTVFIVLGARYRKMRALLKKPEDVPKGLNPFFDAMDGFFESEGFKFSHYQIVSIFEDVEQAAQWQKVYLHDVKPIFAVVSPARIPEPSIPADVYYLTVFSDGSSLRTVNDLAHKVMGVLPRTELQDPYSEDPSMVLQTHKKRLSELSAQKKPVLLSKEAYLKYEIGISRDFVDQSVSAGSMLPTGDGLYRMGLRGALRFAIKTIKGANRSTALLKKARARMKKAPASGPGAIPPLPLAAEVQAFIRHQSFMERLRVPLREKMLLFFGSFALFMGVGILAFDLVIAVALLAALFIHEMGHALAMRIFGFKNVHVVFLPMMGALTLGKSEDRKPWQDAVMFLMGPVPGIFLGLGMLYMSTKGGLMWLSEPAYIFIAINLLNMIPIMPLDGGQLVNRLILSHSPFLQSAFYALSSVAAALGAFFLKEPVLGFLAAIIIIASLKSFQSVRSVKALRAKFGGAGNMQEVRTKAYAEIFRMLRNKPYTNVRFQQKIQTAKALQETLFSTKPEFLTSFFFMGAYGSVIVASAVILMSIFYFGSNPEILKTKDYQSRAEFKDGLTVTHKTDIQKSDSEEYYYYFGQTYEIRKSKEGNHAYECLINSISDMPMEDSAVEPRDAFDQERNVASDPELEELEEELANSSTITYFLDSKGRTVGTEQNELYDLGYLSFWIPASEVTENDPVFGVYRAGARDRLFGREILPLRYSSFMKSYSYYDVETGFLLISGSLSQNGKEFIVNQYLAQINDERLAGTVPLIASLVKSAHERGESLEIRKSPSGDFFPVP